MNIDFKKIGWNESLQTQFQKLDIKGGFAARVIAQKGETYSLISKKGVHSGKVTGRFRYLSKEIKNYPVVGDFVIIKKVSESNEVLIQELLQRKNAFSRKIPISGGRKMKNGIIDGGVTQEQVIASNIDTLFIICGLDNNFNIPRLERYLILAKHNKLDVVILLNKLDLCEDIGSYTSRVEGIAKGVPVIPLSALTRDGVEQLSPYLKEGKTVSFIGSSGVGKSTLLNTLLETEVQFTQIISDHSGKGKHTTTHREMFFHPSGAMIIDTPGIKELQLWAEDEDLEHVYQDIVDLTNLCRFNNCTHNTEPGCAIKDALENGSLDERRYQNYRKSRRELSHLKERQRGYVNKMKKRGVVKS